MYIVYIYTYEIPSLETNLKSKLYTHNGERDTAKQPILNESASQNMSGRNAYGTYIGAQCSRNTERNLDSCRPCRPVAGDTDSGGSRPGTWVGTAAGTFLGAWCTCFPTASVGRARPTAFTEYVHCTPARLHRWQGLSPAVIRSTHVSIMLEIRIANERFCMIGGLMREREIESEREEERKQGRENSIAERTRHMGWQTDE